MLDIIRYDNQHRPSSQTRAQSRCPNYLASEYFLLFEFVRAVLRSPRLRAPLFSSTAPPLLFVTNTTHLGDAADDVALDNSADGDQSNALTPTSKVVDKLDVTKAKIIFVSAFGEHRFFCARARAC